MTPQRRKTRGFNFWKYFSLGRLWRRKPAKTPQAPATTEGQLRNSKNPSLETNFYTDIEHKALLQYFRRLFCEVDLDSLISAFLVLSFKEQDSSLNIPLPGTYHVDGLPTPPATLAPIITRTVPKTPATVQPRPYEPPDHTPKPRIKDESPFPLTSAYKYKKQSRKRAPRPKTTKLANKIPISPKIVIVISDDEDDDKTEGEVICTIDDAGGRPEPSVWRGMNTVDIEQDKFNRVTAPNFSLRLVYDNAGVRSQDKHVNCFITKGGSHHLIPVTRLNNSTDARYIRLRNEGLNPVNDRWTRDSFNDEAAALIFDLNNRGRHWTEMDLHNLRVHEARNIVLEYFTVIGRIPINERPEFLTVIVGKGLHSPGGIPVLPNAIQSLCREYGKQFWAPPGEGHIIVDMKTVVKGAVSIAQIVPKRYLPEITRAPTVQVVTRPSLQTKG